jgi:hypothetical protein
MGIASKKLFERLRIRWVRGAEKSALVGKLVGQRLRREYLYNRGGRFGNFRRPVWV